MDKNTPKRTPPRFLIAGRPNVGKSELFNRICGGRKAIVSDEPGVTRDMLTCEAEWLGRNFVLLDTGGLVPGSKDPISSGIEKKVMEACAGLEGVVLVMNVEEGVMPLDEELFALFKKVGVKNLVVAVNKVDSSKREQKLGEFHRFGDFLALSAAHGRGIDVLLDWLAEKAGLESGEHGAAGDEPLRFTVVGRPNVGKSSLINRIVGYGRVLVDSEPGTTRDPVEIPYSVSGQSYVIVDTAGMRRKARAGEDLELLVVKAAKKALQRAELAVLLMDATEPVSHQDIAIAGSIVDRQAGIIIALNKWDLVKEGGHPVKPIMDEARRRFRFARYAPIITISAKTGYGIKELFSCINRIDRARSIRIPTPELNELFADLRSSAQQTRGGSWMKIKYITQLRTRPPIFAIFSHSRSTLKPAVERMVISRLRRAYPLEGTPIVLRYRRS